MSTKTHAKPGTSAKQAEKSKLAGVAKQASDLAKDDMLWKAQFDSSADVAQSIDDEVMEEYRSGRTTRIGK